MFSYSYLVTLITGLQELAVVAAVVAVHSRFLRLVFNRDRRGRWRYYHRNVGFATHR